MRRVRAYPFSDAAQIVVRLMRVSDVAAVSEILAESPEAAVWPRACILQSAASAESWVAEVSGGVRGFLIGRRAADEFEILNLAVAPGYRRRGIASKLVEIALESSRNMGSRQVYLEVRASNGAATCLYARHGFRTSGRRVRYYQSPVEDAILLSRDLA